MNTKHQVRMAQTTDSDPSDSTAQREIELTMIHRVGEQHPDWQAGAWKTLAYGLGLSSVWQNAEPDAVWKTDSNEVVIAECYARVGQLKPGNSRKLAMDASKLLSLRNAVTDCNRLRCLLVVPEELDQQLHADGWFPVAIRQAADVVAVKLTDNQRQKLREAVKRQGAGQARTKRAGNDRTE